jgi:hypothetical protein
MRFRRDGRHFTGAVKQWFFAQKKSRQIVIIVFLTHCAVASAMCLSHKSHSHSKHSKSIIVHTIRHPPSDLQPAPLTTVPVRNYNSAPMPSPSAAPSKRTKPAAVKSAVKTCPSQTAASSSPAVENHLSRYPVAPKQPLAKKKPKIHASPREEASANEALYEIKAGLERIASAAPVSHSQPDIVLPPPLHIQTSTTATVEEAVQSHRTPSTYSARLIELLQSSLQLPEVGRVRLKIAIVAPGQIRSIQILETKSEKNASFLQHQLPLLDLPSFHDSDIIGGNLEFTVTFSNA